MISDNEILDAACMFVPACECRQEEQEIIRLVKEALEHDGNLTITDMHLLEYVVRNTVESLMDRPEP